MSLYQVLISLIIWGFRGSFCFHFLFQVTASFSYSHRCPGHCSQLINKIQGNLLLPQCKSEQFSLVQRCKTQQAFPILGKWEEFFCSVYQKFQHDMEQQEQELSFRETVHLKMQSELRYLHAKTRKSSQLILKSIIQYKKILTQFSKGYKLHR